MAIGRAVVCYAQAVQAFSAGIKCRHCSNMVMGFAPTLLLCLAISTKKVLGCIQRVCTKQAINSCRILQ